MVRGVVPLALLIALLVVAPASAALPRVQPKPVSIGEGDSGTAVAKLPVVAKRKVRRTVRVRYRTLPGSASPGDFEARSGTVRIRKGKRRGFVRVRIFGDTLDELDEALRVKLSKPRGARLGRVRAATVTIRDDDLSSATGDEQPGEGGPGDETGAQPGGQDGGGTGGAQPAEPPEVTVADRTVTEAAGPSDSLPHGLILQLNRAAAGEVRVDYQFANRTASAGDVEHSSGTAVFAPGETQKALPGLVRGDALDELDETVDVTLSNAVGATVPKALAVLTIADDPGDLPPELSAAGISRAENAAGPAEVTVTLSAPSGRTVTVAYETATTAGQADALDFTATSGTLTYAPGETSKVVPITITDDTRDEPDQQLTVAFTQPGGASMSVPQAVVTIMDDDPLPSLAINDVSKIEANTLAQFTVSLSAVSEKTVSVRATTVASTATGGSSCSAGTDYLTFINVLVTIPAGAPSDGVGVIVCNDAVSESAETASVNLSSPSNATIGDGSGVLTILDND